MYRAAVELLLRPVEAVLGAACILIRRGTPATLRGGPGAMLVLAGIWFATSRHFDIMLHPNGIPWPWFGPAFEIAAWTIGLWVFLDRFGDFRRFRQTWLAVAGMSILIWMAGMTLVAVGAFPWGGSISCLSWSCTAAGQWDHGGGFSLDASVRIEAHDRQGLERLLRYCARPLFAADRLEELDAQRLIYHLPKPGPDGRTQLILSPLELIGRIAALVPPPRQHRHRYYGVLVPNSPLRPAVTALAPEAVAPGPESKPAVETAADDLPEAIGRSPARYLWAMLLARIYEAFPLTCPHCGAEMRIIAAITETAVARQILEHIGEPATPPRIAQARGPPEWEGEEPVFDGDHEGFDGDPPILPEPEFEFDQRVAW
ncbi:MAG: transposase [Gammaproteobacteria bacterium]|nr:transposase [Gammaproteobacteria bacterium]MBU1655364.1 transposase [Gammaproteobacteria bacterium]